MRLSKEEYRQAEGCLKRYNYNRVTILNIKADIISVGAINYDGMPKAKYNISDSVANSIIQLQENKDLQTALKECSAVEKALFSCSCIILFATLSDILYLAFGIPS